MQTQLHAYMQCVLHRYKLYILIVIKEKIQLIPSRQTHQECYGNRSDVSTRFGAVNMIKAAHDC